MGKIKVAQIGTSKNSHGGSVWRRLLRHSDIFEVVGYAFPENEREKFPEAVKAFLPVIMPKLGLDRIKGICLADNKASVKVMERCGFQKEFEGIGPYQGEQRPICKFFYQLS
jgi:hypothetical protein